MLGRQHVIKLYQNLHGALSIHNPIVMGKE